MTYEPGWAWQPEKCPCDRDFLGWAGDFVGKTIFHMGTGAHHKVGLELYHYNDVVGLTYSPEELLEYTKLVEQDYWLQRGYTVFFGNIHHINLKVIPRFDLVTLFHLGEIVPFGYRGGEGLIISTMQRKLKQNGRILAYTGSVAAPIALPLFDQYLELEQEYKSLRIYNTRP